MSRDTQDKMIRYTKKDFLSYAEAFGDNQLTYDEIPEARHETWLRYISHWSLEELQQHFGFTHKNNVDGKEIYKPKKTKYEEVA